MFLRVTFWLLARDHYHGMNILQKDGSKRSFLVGIGAETFWTEPGRVSTAYTVDK